MARPGVTYQDIANAAHELKGQGKNVTIDGVRAILGTGSIGTINQHLRKWKEAQASTYNISTKENLPESLIALVKGLWDGVVEQSTEQFHPIEEAYKQEISELKVELEKYKNNNQRWQKMFNQWQQEKASLINEKLMLEQGLAFAHKENQTLQGKHDASLHQLQEKKDRIAELHRLHQQTQHNLEHYRESAREQRIFDQQQFEQQKNQLFAEIKLLKEEIITQRNTLTELKQENTDLSKNYHAFKATNVRIQQENEQLRVESIALEKQKQEYLILYQNYQNQCKEFQKTINDNRSELINHQTENKIILNDLTLAKNELKIIQDQLQLNVQEKWELIQEKASLEGQIKQMQKYLVTQPVIVNE